MKIFCPHPAPGVSLSPLFYFKFSPEEKVGGLFKEDLPPNYFEYEAEYVSKPEEAEIIVLPNNFTVLNESIREYINLYAEMGTAHRKPVFIFSCGDHTDTLIFDSRVKVFRYSLYLTVKSKNDISIPTLTEDVGRAGITLRQKDGVPTVSFCGKAGFSSSRERYAGLLKAAWYQLISVIHPYDRARIRGVFWRIWSVRILQKSPLVKTLFILRKTFSGAEKTIELDPTQARKEFINSLINTDFVLAPKGDGNYSNRFLEALSMGRFPVVPDTDCVFPLENEIPYEKVVVRVPMNRLACLGEEIKAFYDALTPEEFMARQKLAREIFEMYLRQDSFFRAFFNKIVR